MASTPEQRYLEGMLKPDEIEVVSAKLLEQCTTWLAVADAEDAEKLLKEWKYWVGEGLKSYSSSWSTLRNDLIAIEGNDEEHKYQSSHRLKYLHEFLYQVISPLPEREVERTSGKFNGLNITGHGVRGLSRRRVRSEVP